MTATTRPGTLATSGQLATFRLDGDLYGVEVEHVQEVLRSQKLTRVPLAPPAVAGLINLRGQVVTAIELRERLGRPPRPEGTDAVVIVVRLHGGEVLAKELKRRTARTVELASLNPEHEDRTLNLGEVAWMARVMWVRQ